MANTSLVSTRADGTKILLVWNLEEQTRTLLQEDPRMRVEEAVLDFMIGRSWEGETEILGFSKLLNAWVVVVR